MVMKLYGTTTPTVQRAILPLYLADHVDPEKEMEMVLVSFMARAQLTPEYKAKNPFAVVPFLEDGDISIFESRSIAIYLVEKYKLTHLVGETLKEKAAISQWVQSEAHNFDPPVTGVVREFYGAKRSNRPVDEKVITTNLATLGKVLDVYEAELSKRKYLAGSAYTLADALHTPFIDKVQTLELFAGVLDERPHVKAWAADITSNPAFVKVTKLDWDNATPLLESVKTQA